MAFSLSPGVTVSEVDLTTVVPSVQSTTGAIAGYFNWGPVNKITLVPTEVVLATQFSGNPILGPDVNSAVTFFTAASFLAYGNSLQVVRTVGANCNNATSNTSSAGIQIQNEDIFQYSYLTGNNNNKYGPFVARYPGVRGNGITVSLCDSTPGSFANWQYSNYFQSAPGTSNYVSNAGGANDEIHIVVVDGSGLITGTANTVLETYPFVSKAFDASIAGQSTYYKQVIFNKSQYIYAIDPPSYSSSASTWGQTASNTNFYQVGTITTTLSQGSDDVANDNNIINGYSLFANKEYVNISLVMTAGASTTVQQSVVNNVVTTRGDCVAFLSPPQAQVVGVTSPSTVTTNIISWAQGLGFSSNYGSYVVADSGWKYMYDKYSNTYRWIPLNGDIAGLCVYTDTIADPWFSPAGFNRGGIKNAVRLAWNPQKTYRDQLYSAGINPVVSFPGQGIVLYGDKTLQSKPSAFDRINVRRLFIVLEKAISTAAQYSLFEINDNFTRAQFVSLVTPYLRQIQGRRGITDFKVVCDTTNNTPQVIDSNQFVGDIYIKPARSINFIQLNFIAVGTGVDFSTVVL